MSMVTTSAPSWGYMTLSSSLSKEMIDFVEQLFCLVGGSLYRIHFFITCPLGMCFSAGQGGPTLDESPYYDTNLIHRAISMSWGLARGVPCKFSFHPLCFRALTPWPMGPFPTLLQLPPLVCWILSSKTLQFIHFPPKGVAILDVVGSIPVVGAKIMVSSIIVVSFSDVQFALFLHA